MADALVVKNTYNFEVYPTAILGTGFQGITLLAIMDWETAITIDDVQSRHLQVLPTLPVNTPSNFRHLTYLMIRTADGQKRVIAQEWIRADTIALKTSNMIVVSIQNVAPADAPRIRLALEQNGYANVTLEIK